jgi:uncharacterized membrane protein (UPF0136 family)
MYYVELMRARRVLFWYTIIAFGLAALIAVSVLTSHGHTDTVELPLADILIVSAVGAYVLATILSTTLVSEASTLPITWTRPVSRQRIAWSFIAVDAGAILAGYLVTVAAALACIAASGLIGYLRVTPGAALAAVLALGSALLWYALTSAASSRLSGHGVRVAALSWFVFLVIAAVWAAPVPAPIHAVLTALNYLNPTAYISGIVTEGQHARGQHPIPTSQTLRIALEWSIAVVAAVLAVRLWSTREA